MIPPLQQHTQRRHYGRRSPEELVQEFNNLPSPRAIFTFMPNDWIFAIRHMPFEPYLTMLVAAHPVSGDVAQLATSSASDGIMRGLTAGAPYSIVNLLLSGFLQYDQADALDTPMPAGHENARAKAPYKWAAESEALAAATAAELRRQGVRESLCRVGVATKKQLKILDDVWLGLVNDTKQQLQSQYLSPSNVALIKSDQEACVDKICHTCGVGIQSTSLLKCTACSEAWYCSQDCQRTDWKKDHKAKCRSVASPSTGADGTT
ncbi:hypothetical protein LTR10_010728 [Elasticomyces elasticus]|nr:hypothetical protein LTR10_010728 [Elasticomyces elasticus]KAK4968334.1 hypothetical protein LTR42_009617 [Elasticomyces elasticus]